jgi:dolichyl-phosphate-mannose--protein O-mannosyl transferase
LLVRLIFIDNQGFTNDVQTFKAWTISLLDHGLANFYGETSFVDYPPGYFYILAIVGHLWAPFRGSATSYDVLRWFVKVPAILADLGIGVLLYAIAKRFASTSVALFTAAVYVLNPAVIFVSASYGQVDSVAAIFVLLAAYWLLESDDRTGDGLDWHIPAAWIALAYSLLIKPQAAIVIPVFIAFAFAVPSRRRARISGTLVGIALALVFSWILAEPFHPTANPLAAMVWLLSTFAKGASQYPDNSVNAFNLWAIKGQLWLSDSQPLFGLPQYFWGLGLVVAASVLIVWRYVTDRAPGALLEACALSLLAFFILATRMHERYSFDGFLFVIACIPLGRRYLWGALALTVVLFANLVYALQYLAAMTGQMPGADGHNLWGPVTSFYAVVAVGTFFLLGYQYLGNVPEEAVAPGMAPPGTVSPRPAKARSGSFDLGEWLRSGRTAFDPSEGLAAMRAPLDYLLMSGLGLFSFVLSYINYWIPAKTDSCWTIANVTHCGVFDEIYFARAAEEYLRNMRIYENTHPPLSKLLVTLSVTMFGGLAHGDNSTGWRFLDVVFGALVVMLLYAFAKRVTRSTLFASLCSFFLILDGMHFVQSRIATPEGFVVLFATGAVYAFYRFWIASQTEERQHVVVPPIAFAVACGAALLGGALTVVVWDIVWSHMALHGQLDRASGIIVTLYVATGLYLVARYVVFPRMYADGSEELTFADGSYALVTGGRATVFTPDGGSVEGTGGKAKVRPGSLTVNRGGSLQYEDDDLTITYRGDPSVTYDSSSGSATYAQNEIRSGDHVERGGSATLWLVVFTVALGLLVSTKWYGVMGFGVSFIALAFVWAQRYFRAGRPAQWGNPRGFRLDGALATIVFISATVYALVWVPDLIRQSPDPGEVHNFNEVVSRQYDMFHYHDTLTATHPYSSHWWEWPLDYVPIAYYYQDIRAPKDKNDPHACCVEEITSMPNPFMMWFGLITVPIIGVLAWKQRNKAYALIVLTYLLQWLPWMKSPRITFAYHFYVDIPLICLCNALVLQKIWEWSKKRESPAEMWGGRAAVGAVLLTFVFGFVFFYPILSAQHIPWDAWNMRMWTRTWIVGPG